jgi:hypothetical protein
MRRAMKLDSRTMVVLLPMHEPVDKHQDKSDTNHHRRVIYDHRAVSCVIRRIGMPKSETAAPAERLTHRAWRDWPERWDAKDDCEDDAEDHDSDICRPAHDGRKTECSFLRQKCGRATTVKEQCRRHDERDLLQHHARAQDCIKCCDCVAVSVSLQRWNREQ